MLRLLLKPGQQKDFLLKAKNELGGKTAVLAELCGVHERTIRDWLREKYHISQPAAQKISERLKIRMPEVVEMLPDFWSTPKAGKVGAIARYKIYGNPGTKEGRSKGGKRGWLTNQENIKKGILTGFTVRKKVDMPAYGCD